MDLDCMLIILLLKSKIKLKTTLRKILQVTCSFLKNQISVFPFIYFFFSIFVYDYVYIFLFWV